MGEELRIWRQLVVRRTPGVAAVKCRAVLLLVAWNAAVMYARTYCFVCRQAIYCLGRVLRVDKADNDARWDRAVLHAQAGNTQLALQEFEVVRSRTCRACTYCWTSPVAPAAVVLSTV